MEQIPEVNPAGKIFPVEISKEMKSAYIDYSMSVIVSRALPDVRDGLKPVHRRILYTMYEAGLYPDRPYRKSATTVGDVLGKYHPHGDAAVYDTLVRLAQDFSLRYPLVDGQGNFGSIDGDAPAAYRYTEARMAKIAMDMLSDIDKETVDYQPNFDDRHKEPVVLPARFPNLLANGSTGIAVGMATSIPSHNLGELIDAIEAIIDNPELTFDELLQYVKGPDFPTGGIILGYSGIRQAYYTGRSKLRVRAKAEIEEWKDGRYRIVVTEIPYMVNKARLVESIAEHVKDKRIEGISDLRDESDKSGMSVVIELKRDANPQVVLNQLYKYTQMEDTFPVNMIALHDGVPRTMTLREMLDYYTLWLHQVKTPIAAMHLLLQELDDGPRAALDAELFKIEQYTDMALTYLRLESSSTDYVLRRCDLDAVVKRAVRKFAGFFVRGRISLAYDGLRYTALTDEKWLVFVNTAVDGIRLEAQLQGNHIDACFLYEEDAAAYEELIQQQKSNCRVLIVEARLRSNLSITDPTLKNIVLPFASISSIKQMLQVKQRTPNETVRVYFEDANAEKVLDFLQESIHQSLNVMARAHAGQNAANRFFNLPACYHAYYQICFSLYLLQKMQTDPKQSYIKILLSHLSGKEPSAAIPKINAPQTFQEIIEEAKVQLAAYLETLTPLALVSPDESGSFDQLQTLKQKINTLHKLVYGRILDDKWKDTSRFFPEAKLNAFLSSLSLPYTIQSSSKNGVRTTIVTNITK